ncbi:MAG: hypothetical protein KF900_00015 [Bacteroidetes bacterium]|nr:hypothetical protein [Bacteroidota bacterium]
MLFLFVTASCSRRGCTDANAENFEPNAKTDCGCCFYQAKGKVWAAFDKTESLRKNGVTGLKLYAGENLAGGIDFKSYVPTYFLLSSSATSNPDYNSFTYQKTEGDVLIVELDTSKEKEMQVRIDDQNNNTLWTGNVVFKAATVTFIELN